MLAEWGKTFCAVFIGKVLEEGGEHMMLLLGRWWMSRECLAAGAFGWSGCCVGGRDFL